MNNKLSKIRLLLIMLILVSASACTIFKANVKSPYKQATINEPGDIYASYGLANNDEAKQKILDNGISNDLLSDICKYSEEQNWPPLMQKLDSRLSNRENIIKYKARLITTFDNLCILAIPNKGNKEVPKKMLLDRDFYIIIRCEAIYIDND